MMPITHRGKLRRGFSLKESRDSVARKEIHKVILCVALGKAPGGK